MYKEKHKPDKFVTLQGESVLFWKDDSTALMWRERPSGFISLFSLQSPHPLSLLSHLSPVPRPTLSFLHLRHLASSSNPGSRDLPGGPVVRTLPPNAGSAGLVPGQEMRPHTVWPKRKSQADSVAGAEFQSYSLPQPFLTPSLNYHFHLFPQLYYLNVGESWTSSVFPHCKPFHRTTWIPQHGHSGKMREGSWGLKDIQET